MRNLSYPALLLLITSGLTSLVWCQEGSVSLTTGVRGTVKDSSQAVIPGATVKLASNVGPTQEAASDAQGQYSFSGLRGGTYRVSVALAGFESFQGDEIQLTAGQQVQQNVTLNAAGTKTVTEVVGDAPQVETSDPSVYNTLSSKELTGYQLNGRNFIQLIALTPGVSNQTGQDEAAVGAQGSAAYSVNGGRTEYNTFDLDGSDLLNVGFNGAVNTLIVYPSLDAIGEMKILTSNFGAMYGRTASGTVLVHTKSGTTDFHGDLYYFNRNEAFNARNFFDETKGAPLYRRHDLGGTIGGPLTIPGVYNKTKDKTFFFFSEEYRTEKTPYQFNQGVPSAAERNGDFSDVCPNASQVYRGTDGQPFFFRTAPQAGLSAFPDCPGKAYGATPQVNGNILYNAVGFSPYSYSAGGATVYNHLFDPSGSVFLNRNAGAILGTGIIPLPNATSGCNSTINSCFDASVSEPTHWREELFRIDQYLNERNRLMFRFVHDAWDTVTAKPQFGIITNNVPTIENNFTGPGINAVLRFSQTLSPTLLNEAYVSYGNSAVTLTDRNGVNSLWQRPAELDAPCTTNAVSNPPSAQCGLGYLFPNGFGGKMPGLQFLGNSAYGGGFSVDSGYMPWTHTNPVYSFGDTLTKQWGKHFLQAGAEMMISLRDQTNSVSGAATGDTQGILTYSNRSSYSGNAFANFLIEQQNNGAPGSLVSGNVDSFQQDSGQATYRQRYTIAEPYIQDDWKVTPRLTVNLGLRVSLFGTYHEKNDTVYNWVPSAFNPVLASQITIDTINTGALQVPAPNFNSQGSLLSFAPGSPDVHLLNGLVRCGYNGVPASCMSNHLVNPAPRVGFAWDPFGSGRTSIRGGYGIFFEHGTGNETNTGSLEGSAPQVLNMTTTYVHDLSCIGSANPGICQTPATAGQILAFPLNVTSIQRHAQWPYVQQWSLSVQRELPMHTVATVSYVGSKGTHLTAETQANSIPSTPLSQNPFGQREPFLPGTPTGLGVLQGGDCTQQADASNHLFYGLLNGNNVYQGTPAYNNISIACSYAVPVTSGPLINSLRPYLGIGQIASLNNIANSSYNSLQVTARRTTGPLTMGVSYTYSHSLDNSSDRFDPVPDAFNVRANWASSSFDQRHLINISYIYDVYTPGSWSQSRLLRNSLQGWQWSGITVFQSGIPF